VITLALDASTYVGSVCLARGRDVLLARTAPMRGARSERLMPEVAAALGDAGLTLAGVDRIVCGEGPGSFTSLRIAASIGKGLAVAAGRPLYAVSSLALMVAAVDPPLGPGEYVAVLDALRGEAYAARCLVREAGQVADVGDVGLLAREDVAALAREGRAVVGDERGIDGAPDARGVVGVAALLDRDGPVDLAAWEPRYGRMAEAQRRWEAAHGRSLFDA
jgi:tRNA threonylcarbamoyladenosine biosynthesis protein TsaB